MFGAECGGGLLALKKRLGISRKFLDEKGLPVGEMEPGKFELRPSKPPQKTGCPALLLISRSRENTPPRRC